MPHDAPRPSLLDAGLNRDALNCLSNLATLYCLFSSNIEDKSSVGKYEMGMMIEYIDFEGIK